MSNVKTGFTLIELLIVIGIIAVLVAAVIIAINPAEQFRNTRNITRESHARAINTALLSYQIDNRGTIHANIDFTLREICNTRTMTCAEVPAGHCDGLANLCFLVPTYISSIPVDPRLASNSIFDTAYAVSPRGIGYWVARDRIDRTGVVQGRKEIVCPTGWIGVPGNPLFGTRDFCVMKYEAKYDCTGDGLGDTGAECVAFGHPGAEATGGGVHWHNIPRTTARVVSTPQGTPIVHISRDGEGGRIGARAVCEAIGGRLITNAEWMTIARNIETNPVNWTGGAVGTGLIFRGHSDNAPANVLVASPDDGAGYFGTDNVFPSDQRRTLSLTNGNVIWDLPGNIWELVDRPLLVNRLPHDGGAIGWRWIEHTAITHFGDMSYDEIRPSGATWNTAQGMGGVWTNNDPAISGRILVRGAHWGRGTMTGVFSLDLLWVPWNLGWSVGFRCSR